MGWAYFALFCGPPCRSLFSYLMASGGDADVYTYDLRGRRCVRRWANDGGTPTSAMATSPDNHRFMAVASESGVVNVYDQPSGLPGPKTTRPRPLKGIMNLTTPIESLRFNHDGQLLAMGSRWEKEALRLVHLPTCTVFSNWPTSKTPLSYIFSIDFSPKSGFFAVGNDKGKVLLYRLKHYTDV